MEIVVFTNGCFDILHPGHVELLEKARRLGTKLIVGINSDRSVRAIKGAPRPFLNENARAKILRALKAVDEVLIFDENTPEQVIKEIRPDVLVKGGDWKIGEIVGADFVLDNGGEVRAIPFESDYSTSKLAEKIQMSSHDNENRNLQGFDAPDNLTKNSARQALEIYQYLVKEQSANLLRCAELIEETWRAEKRVWLSIKEINDVSAGNMKILVREVFTDRNSNRAVSDFTYAKDDLLLIFGSGTAEDQLENVTRVMNARKVGCRTIGLLGSEDRKLAALCDAAIYLPFHDPEYLRKAQLIICGIWDDLICGHNQSV